MKHTHILCVTAILLTACGTQREPLATAPDLRGRDESCAVILTHLRESSEIHKSKSVAHGLKSNTGTIASVVAAPFTLGASALGYLAYKMTFPSDGGTGEAYREWEHWNKVAWLKGCSA